MTNADSSFELCSFDILSAFELRHSSFRPHLLTYLLTHPPLPMPRLDTIIVLLRDRVACATFGARSTIKKFVTLARTDVDEPNVAVVAALGALGEKLGEVAVLSTDCATHTLELPASSVMGLSAEAVEQAVAFEVEPLAGMNAGDAAVALQPLPSVPGRNRFWVTMATYSFRDTIESAVSAFGGRLAVLAHTGRAAVNRSVATPREVSIGGASSSGADR